MNVVIVRETDVNEYWVNNKYEDVNVYDIRAKYFKSNNEPYVLYKVICDGKILKSDINFTETKQWNYDLIKENNGAKLVKVYENTDDISVLTDNVTIVDETLVNEYILPSTIDRGDSIDIDFAEYLEILQDKATVDNMFGNIDRTDQKLIDIVISRTEEEPKVKVVEIPDDVLWTIELEPFVFGESEHEYVCEVHRTWR